MRPSLETGYAPRDGDFLYPELQRGKVWGICPGLGYVGEDILPDYSGHRGPADRIGGNAVSVYDPKFGSVLYRRLNYANSAYYELPNNGAVLRTDRSFTVICWAKVETFGDGYPLVYTLEVEGESECFNLFFSNTGNYPPFTFGAANAANTWPSTRVDNEYFDFELNTWYHIAIVWDGLSFDRSSYTLYVNNQNTPFTSAGALGSRQDPSRVFSGDGPNNRLRGWLASLDVYDYALPPDIIGRHFELPPYEHYALAEPQKFALGAPVTDISLAADLAQSESLTADLTIEVPGDVSLAADLDQSESLTADLTVELAPDVDLAADLDQSESLTADLTIEAPGDVILAADLDQSESLTANLTVDIPGEVSLSADLSQLEALSADLTIELPAPDLAADLSQSETLTALLTIEGAVAVSAVHYRGAVVLPYYRANSVLPHYRG